MSHQGSTHGRRHSDHSPLCSCSTGSALATAAVSLPCNRRARLHPIARADAGSDSGLCRGCRGPAWPRCKPGKSTLAAIARGTSSLQCRTTRATPPWAFGFSQSWTACMPILLWQRHEAAPLSPGLTVEYWVVGFLDKGLGPGKLLSADLGLSQGIRF